MIDALFTFLILAVVYLMGAVMWWDLSETCREQVGPRLTSVPQPSLFPRANGWASAEGNEAEPGANKLGPLGTNALEAGRCGLKSRRMRGQVYSTWPGHPSAVGNLRNCFRQELDRMAGLLFRGCRVTVLAAFLGDDTAAVRADTPYDWAKEGAA